MRTHKQAVLLHFLQSTTFSTSQAPDTRANRFKLHQKTTWIADQLTLQSMRIVLQEERMLRDIALVASMFRNKMTENYMWSKSSGLIDQIKIRSQHPQRPARRCGNKYMNELLPHEEILPLHKVLKRILTIFLSLIDSSHHQKKIICCFRGHIRIIFT